MGKCSASVPPRRRRQLSPSPRPPPTTFHRQAHSAHHPRNITDKLSPLVDGVASHHLYDDVSQRPTAVVSTSSPLQLPWPLPNLPLVQILTPAHAFNHDRPRESRSCWHDRSAHPWARGQSLRSARTQKLCRYSPRLRKIGTLPRFVPSESTKRFTSYGIAR